MKFLITGGAGYIGSTIASALEDEGHTPIILDSLITGKIEFTKHRIFYCADIADAAMLETIFHKHPDIYATVHCAALISVPESTTMPYDYYHENVVKSLELFRTLNHLGYKRVLFSSSCSVYDTVPGFKVTETAPLRPKSPYARTKYMTEMILKDFCQAYGMRGIALRYFNPIGADPMMRSGIHRKDSSLVIVKLVATALGLQEQFLITGVNWPTRDGSGIRDYIHVWDLAKAHIKALTCFDNVFEQAGDLSDGYLVINLGNGYGVTVKELVSAFEKVWGKPINKRETDPRPGDVAGAYASNERARDLLNWLPEKTIEDMITDALKWGEVREKILGFR